jgi:uncharacterized membrane protein
MEINSKDIHLKDYLTSFFHKHGRLYTVEIYLIALLLVFGGLACFLLPVSGGFDEEEHLIRVWEMSDYTFLPNEKLGNKLPFPAIFREMSYRREFMVRAVPTDFWNTYGALAFDSKGYIHDIDTRSVYSPPLLLPQALAMRFFGRREHWPALAVFYACRIAGLLSYILLTFLAIRIIPFGKWLLAVLALSPVAILQSATISPDTISNGFAFLFIAGCLAVAQRNQMGWREFSALTVLIFILLWGKVNIVPLVILPFLIIRPSRYQIKFGYWLLIGIAILLLAVEVAGWNLFAYSRYHDALNGADPSGQVRFILSDPLQFVRILATNVWENHFSYMQAWAAIYGFGYWFVPIWTYYLYAAALLGALLMQENENVPDQKVRFGLIVTFVAAYLWTIVSLYLSYTPVGSQIVQGVQGRYFAGVMPLLFLALASLPFFKRIQIPHYLPGLVGALCLFLYVGGMYLSYHVVCGSQYYTGGLCYLPNYKNWAPNDNFSPPVSADLTLKQEVVGECDKMTEFRVWMDASTSQPQGITEFSLVDAKTRDVIVNTSVVNADLPEKSWYVLRFAPIPNSAGRLYLFSTHSESAKGPQIAYSLKTEYTEGILYENENEASLDMIFQMGCVAGWNK